MAAIKRRTIIQVVLFIIMFMGCYLGCYAESAPASSDVKFSTVTSALFLFGSIAGTFINIYLGNRFMKAKADIMVDVRKELLQKTEAIDKHIENTDGNVQRLQEQHNNSRVDIVERINDVSQDIIDRINDVAIKVAKLTKD